MGEVDRATTTQLVCLHADGHRLGRFTLLRGAGIHLVLSCSLNRCSFAIMERVNAEVIAIKGQVAGLSDPGTLSR